MSLTDNINNIDSSFPVKGIDNPSQGFRDNFHYIKDSLIDVSAQLTTMNFNVTSLQNSTVLPKYISTDLSGIPSVEGSVVYFTDINKIGFYNGTSWQVISSTTL